MKDLLEKVKDLNWKQILATAVLVASLVGATMYFSSCNVARSAVSGDRVADKHIRDSTHYEVELKK